MTREPEGYPLFRPGERSNLFLVVHEWSPPAPNVSSFYTEATMTPDRVFKVAGTILTGSGKTKPAQSLIGTPAGALRALLRRGGQ